MCLGVVESSMPTSLLLSGSGLAHDYQTASWRATDQQQEEKNAKKKNTIKWKIWNGNGETKPNYDSNNQTNNNNHKYQQRTSNCVVVGVVEKMQQLFQCRIRIVWNCGLALGGVCAAPHSLFFVAVETLS